MLTTMEVPKGKSIEEAISCSIVNFCAIWLFKLQTQRPGPAQSLMTLLGAEPIIKQIVGLYEGLTSDVF